jgi:hypothetical protein
MVFLSLIPFVEARNLMSIFPSPRVGLYVARACGHRE